MSTTTKAAGPETTAQMGHGCFSIESKGRAADNVADLEKMIHEKKYVTTAFSEEKLFFTKTLTNLCTAFADASGSKHKVCIDAAAACTANMVWKASGDIKFHNKEFGGDEDVVVVTLPTSETTLVEGKFKYHEYGENEGQHIKLALQGYKLATPQ